MPERCAASKSIEINSYSQRILRCFGIRNALDLLDLSGLPTAIRLDDAEGYGSVF